jgi:hypothetical protein
LRTTFAGTDQLISTLPETEQIGTSACDSELPVIERLSVRGVALRSE